MTHDKRRCLQRLSVGQKDGGKIRIKAPYNFSLPTTAPENVCGEATARLVAVVQHGAQAQQLVDHKVSFRAVLALLCLFT